MTTQKYLDRYVPNTKGFSSQKEFPARENRSIGLDSGNRIADDGSARNDTHTHQKHADNRGERSAPVVPSSRTVPTPRDHPQNPPGQPPGREASGQQAPTNPSQSVRQDLNLSRRGDGGGRDRIDLLHRMLDLLESERPGT